MILIFGGACQGKLNFAETSLSLSRDDMFVCSEKQGISYDNRIIADFHNYISGAVQRGDNPVSYVISHMEQFRDKAIIIEDVCGGLVPLGKDQRAYRESTGKIMQLFSQEADEVYRVFCGIGEKLK